MTSARPAPQSGPERAQPAPAERLVAPPAENERLHNKRMVVLLALSLLLRAVLLIRGWPALDSDEAIIGLMARHILRGARPAFYYGQHYLGALDAYIAAVFFAVLGPSTAALRLSMLPLVLGFLLLAVVIGHLAYGKSGATLSLLVLAFGPAYALLRESAVIGGYQETLFLGGALLLLAYQRLRTPEPAPRTRADLWRALGWYALIGLVIGLGIWSDQLILPVVGAALVALVAARPREALRLPGVALVAGAAVGGWPFWSYNLTHQFATFAELAAQNHVAGQVGPFPPLGDWMAQIGSILSVGLPAIMGSPHVCVVHGGAWPSYPPPLVTLNQPALSWCGTLNTLFSLAVLALYALAAVPLARGAWRWWQARSHTAVESAQEISLVDAARRAQEHARQWLRAMLLLTAAGTLLLYSLSKTAQLYQFTAARYLLPLYLTLPLVAGGALQIDPWAFTRVLWPPNHTPGATSPIRQVLVRYGVRLALMAWFAALAIGLTVGSVATVDRSRNNERFALPMPPADQRLIAMLEAHGVTTFVSDYWTCYRLAFESDERLRCAVRDSANGTLTHNGAVNRYAPYLDEVLRAPHPAYIFPAGSEQDATFATWAAVQQLPHQGYTRLVQAGQAIYYYLPHD